MLHKGEVTDLYSSPISLWWAVHVARMGEIRNELQILVGNTLESAHSERGGRILLKHILGKYVQRL
jgi:hypothetical protein